jgi:hypothetical protein
MSAFYELWDLDSGNMIGDFGSEAEALAVVHDLLSVNTTSFVDMLSLGYTSEDGAFRIVAQGRPLAVRADRAVAARSGQRRQVTPSLATDPMKAPAKQSARSSKPRTGRTRRTA